MASVSQREKYATLTHMINELANTGWLMHVLKAWLRVHLELNSNVHPVWLNDTILINKRAFLARFSYMQLIRESNREQDWSYSWYGFSHFGDFEDKKKTLFWIKMSLKVCPFDRDSNQSVWPIKSKGLDTVIKFGNLPLLLLAWKQLIYPPILPPSIFFIISVPRPNFQTIKK